MPDIFDQISFEQEPQKDIFDQISINEKPEGRQIFSELGRLGARSASRIGESLLGFPSDILQTAQLGAKGLEKGAGKIRESLGLKERPTELKKPGMPGSAELKSLSSKLFGDVVEPQSKSEQFLDDVISDSALLAIPVKGKIPFARSIGTALAGNISAEGAKQLGLGEKGQTAAKLGTFFVSGLIGKGNIKKYWNEQYKLAEKAVPENAILDANKLDRQLDKLKFDLRKGGIETPSEKFVQKPLQELQKIIKDGEISVEDAIAAKKKINELRSSLFDEVKGKTARKHARSKINDIAKYLDESLEKYGKENPDFYKHYKAANEAYGGFEQSKKVQNWINRMLPIKHMGKGTLVLLEALFKPALLAATTPAFAALKGGEIAARLMQNNTLRKYYGNLMRSAISENKTGFLKNLKSLENSIEKEDPDLFSSISSVHDDAE